VVTVAAGQRLQLLCQAPGDFTTVPGEPIRVWAVPFKFKSVPGGLSRVRARTAR
jgi:hypothetical protein